MATKGKVHICGTLHLSGRGYRITVVRGTGSRGLNIGSVVGIGRLVSLGLSILNFVSGGVAIGVVGGNVTRGGGLALPGEVMGVIGYSGPHYVAGIRRNVSCRFGLASSVNACHYICYRAGMGGWWGETVVFRHS